MMQKPEIGDEDSASLRTYLDASRMYDWEIINKDVTWNHITVCKLFGFKNNYLKQ